MQIVGKSISKRDIYYEHDFDEKLFAIDSKMHVIATPGHTSEDISVMVETQQGLVAIVGDLFENEKDLEDENVWKCNSEFPELQEKSREMVLKIADYIVPGHGPMFKNVK